MLSIPTQSISQGQPGLRGVQFIRQPDYQHSTVASVATRKAEIKPKESGVGAVICGKPLLPDYAERSVLLTATFGVLVAHGVVRPVIDRFLPPQTIFIENTGETSLPPPILRSSTYKPRTELGKKLWALRLRVAASGARLLDWDDIEQEVAERRESARAGEK